MADSRAIVTNTLVSERLVWERVPEMESRVGICVVRGSGKWSVLSDGRLQAEMLIELAPLEHATHNERDSFLKLSAVADTADGTLVGYAMRNIPRWSEMPPVYIAGHFWIEVDAIPARVRIYPEVN